MLERIKNEPVLVVALVQAVLGLLLAFGVGLTEGQVAALLTLTGATLALFVRRRVAPVRKM